jgi:hypothetical protein
MKKKDGILKRIPLRMRVLMGLIALSAGFALLQGSSTPLETGLWIFISFVFIGILILVLAALIMFALGRKKKEPVKKSEEHHPTPAAAPAAAGHGGGHDDHGHDHGVPIASQIIAVVVVLGAIWLIGFGIKSFVDSPSRANGANNSAEGPRGSSGSSSSNTADPVCANKPSVTESLVIPVEGSYGPIAVPRGQRTCFDPIEKLRGKWSNTPSEPAEWGGNQGKYMWVGITPGESSEPLTVQFWLEPY